MSGRITVLPDDRLVAHHSAVQQSFRRAAALICEGGFDDFFDSTMRDFFCGCLAARGAHEGTVWLINAAGTALIPRFNSGPNAKGFVDIFEQSLSTGMISAVVATEQPMCENAVQFNSARDPRLDQKLCVRTCAMLAVPFYFAGELRGVISAVQLARADSTDPEPPGFSPESMAALQVNAAILGRLLERKLLGAVFGLEESA
jgi:hypothetical protein